MSDRRKFLKQAFAGGAMLAAWPAAAAERWPASAMPENAPSPWDEVPRILARIRPPEFPARDFDVTKYGAVGDNTTDNTAAFQKAIAACAQAGGGRVVVPKGEFITGAIHLRTHVNLHVSEGATIRFTRDTSKYPLVLARFEGMELMNFSPFIYAYEQQNIAVTGAGTIDGNADNEHWWNWKPLTRPSKDPAKKNDRDLLFDMAEAGVPVEKRVFGEGKHLRPNFIEPTRCQNVLIEGVTLLNSPMWQVHPVACTNVTVRNLTIHANGGPNTDGCDPESCTDVLIKDCFFDTGDDCIAIKAGRNADGRRLHTPTQNVVIQGCHMKDGHGGVTVGSEITGGVRNVFAEKCQMDSPHLNIAVRLKNNSMRGGVLENIHVRDITIGQVSDAVVAIDFFYEEGPNGKFPPVVRNVTIQNVTAKKARYGLYLRGFENAPIEQVRLVDCDFEGVAQGNVIENVKDISLRNVRINGKSIERLG
jgi:polygalacturonase